MQTVETRRYPDMSAIELQAECYRLRAINTELMNALDALVDDHAGSAPLTAALEDALAAIAKARG